MLMVDPDIAPMHEPLADLELRLIDDYIRSAGHDPDALRRRSDEAARQILASASAEATAHLAVIECRSQYVRHLHGQG